MKMRELMLNFEPRVREALPVAWEFMPVLCGVMQVNKEILRSGIPYFSRAAAKVSGAKDCGDRSSLFYDA